MEEGEWEGNREEREGEERKRIKGESNGKESKEKGRQGGKGRKGKREAKEKRIRRERGLPVLGGPGQKHAQEDGGRHREGWEHDEVLAR